MDSNSSEPIIIAEAVEKWYDNRFHALRGVNLTVQKQEVVVIMAETLNLATKLYI
jgi:general L-amino acid transport system ATP-binding protein